MRTTAITLLLAAFVTTVEAQKPDSVDIARATALALPPVPALVLLRADPATVTRPGFARDYKLDLLVRNSALAPDIALEAMPIWTLAFRRIDLRQYRETAPIFRTLSTLSVSLGTTERDDQRELAWALKLTPVRYDPILDPDYMRALGDALDISDDQERITRAYADSLIQLRIAMETAPGATARDSLLALRTLMSARADAARLRIQERISANVDSIVRANQQAHWNASALDIGFGRLYRYRSAALDSLQFDAAGTGLWLSGASGFGTVDWLFTGLIQIVDVEGSTDRSVGTNVRYGGHSLSFFAEYLWSDASDGPTTHTLAWGGEVRLTAERAIEFGIRTEYDADFELSRLLPVVKLNWNLADLPLAEILQRLR